MQQGNVGPCGENSCGKKRKHSGEKRAVPVSLSLQNNLNAQGDHQVESTKRNDKNKSKSMAVFDVLSEPCAENSCGKRKNSGALPVALLLQNNVNAQGDQVESTRRSSDDICAENSCGKRKDLGGEKRALPVSLLRNHLSAPEDRVERTRRLRDDTKKSMAVFDVLSEISEEYSSDPSLAKLSALEAAKRGGISFP
ncbi:hypothetical protein M5689_005086 [Euphorbia peplus]|nr:hypothetical protein M5689_005086 [Euphorbia peplus]